MSWKQSKQSDASRGWNVIDTASNYRGGRGEKAIGYALTALHEQLGLMREMLFVSTKAGFLQEDLKNQVRQYPERTTKQVVACFTIACN